MQILLCILLSAAPEWGLSTSVSFIHKANSDGENGVWCASSGGAFHFSEDEGVGSLFSCPDELPVPDCLDVIEDSQGRMWFATGGEGLLMFDGSSWQTYSNFEGIPGEGTVTSLMEAAGEIWVGCIGGVAHGGPQGFTPVGEAFTANDVYYMAERGDTLWLCTDKGIYSLHDPWNPLNPDSWYHWQDTRDLELNTVRTGVSSVYACGKSGALELEPGETRFSFLIDYSSIPDSMITDVIETDQGLFAAIHGDILKRNGEEWISSGTGLPPIRWPICFFEAGGRLYSAFSYQTSIVDITNTQSGLGLFYLTPAEEWGFRQIPGLQCKKVHEMAATDDGRIYLGSYSRGLQAYYPGYGWRGYAEEDGMPNTSQTFAVGKSYDSGVWVSSYHHGLSWVRDNDDWEGSGDTILTFVKDTLEYHSPQSTIIRADIPNNQPVMISGQSNGNWAAFRQFDAIGQPDEPSGILGFNGNPMGTMNWAPRTGGSGIAYINTRCVYPVSEDSLWIAFDDGQGCQLLVHSGDPSDDSQDMWRPGQGQAFTSSSGLPSSEVYCFLEVPGIGFLAGTSAGLARWTGSGFTDYSEITETVKAMEADAAGRIWCLAESGIYRISDGTVSYYNAFNSDYKPSALYGWEYALRDPLSGGVYFSSEEGLWLITQAGGGETVDPEVSFYPQPFVSGEDVLRLTGPPDGFPVTVDFYRLDGTPAGTVEAESLSQWTWDGTLRNKIVSAGIYMVLVTVNERVYQTRITVVR